MPLFAPKLRRRLRSVALAIDSDPTYISNLSGFRRSTYDVVAEPGGAAYLHIMQMQFGTGNSGSRAPLQGGHLRRSPAAHNARNVARPAAEIRQRVV